LEQWPSGEEQQEAESIVSHPLHNPRIQTRPNGPHYGVLVKEVTCTYMLPVVRSDTVEVGVRVVQVGRTSFTMEHQIRDVNEHERLLRRASRPWCGAITSLVGLIPFRRHYALLLNRGRVEPGLHPAEMAGLSNSLFAEHGLPRTAKILLEGGLGLFNG